MIDRERIVLLINYEENNNMNEQAITIFFICNELSSLTSSRKYASV